MAKREKTYSLAYFNKKYYVKELSDKFGIDKHSAIFLNNIKETEYDVEFESEKLKSIKPSEFPIILENKKNMFYMESIDVITGEKYGINYISGKDNNLYQEACIISKSDVVKLLKSLTKEEIKKYKKQKKEIKHTVITTIIKNFIDENTFSLDEEDKYIKKFRKRKNKQ